MTAPENVSSEIETNLTREELLSVIMAIDKGDATEIPGSASVFAGSSGCEFEYDGKRYLINESYEVLDLVLLIPKGKTAMSVFSDFIKNKIRIAD